MMDIREMKPGRELDALVAEHVFKWRKVPGPKTDYDGPCESFDVLVPPTIGDPFLLYPPRGTIRPWWFCKEWSTDIFAALEILEKLKQTHWVTIETDRNGLYYCSFTPFDSNGEMSPFTKNLSEAIAKAALLTMEVKA